MLTTTPTRNGTTNDDDDGDDDDEICKYDAMDMDVHRAMPKMARSHYKINSYFTVRKW